MNRRLVFFILILSSALIFSCKKENTVDNNVYVLHGQKNDINWSTTQGAYFVPTSNSLDSLVLIGQSSGEFLWISIQKNNKGEYIFALDTHLNYSVGGVIASTYNLDSSYTNEMNITSITNQIQTIEGKFTLKLKKVTGDASFPLYITFSNGEFKAKRGAFSL